MKKQSENSACPGIEKFRLSELRPSKYNPRVISKDALAGLTNSISRFGCVEPIVVNVRGKKNTIIGGHQRYRALKRLKIKECICVTVNCSKGDEKLLNLTLNNPHIQGQFEEGIAAYIDELRAGLADQEAYLDLRIAELRGEIEEEKTGLVPDDDVPKPPKKARTKTGDMYILGKHRLLCGDSTKAADMKRLMGRNKADMVFIDPPYGAKITAINTDQAPINRTKHWDMIEGDQFENEELQQFLEKAFMQFSIYSKNNAAWYVWHAMLTQGFFSAAAAADLILNRQIIWVKPCLILAYGHYHWRHELCFYGWKKGHKPKFYGPKNETTVWEIDFDGKGRMPKEERKAPAQKPVSLAERAIKNSSKQREIILDGFLGSGSTLIACEKLERRCFGMEIDPLYCDVTVKRWENFTGRKARLSKAK